MSSPTGPSAGLRPTDEKSDIETHSRVLDVPDQSLDVFEGTLDPVYEAKAKILNDAIQEIGMGKYQVNIRHSRSANSLTDFAAQWHLFFVAGFGWFSYVSQSLVNFY